MEEYGIFEAQDARALLSRMKPSLSPPILHLRCHVPTDARSWTNKSRTRGHATLSKTTYLTAQRQSSRLLPTPPLPRAPPWPPDLEPVRDQPAEAASAVELLVPLQASCRKSAD